MTHPASTTNPIFLFYLNLASRWRAGDRGGSRAGDDGVSRSVAMLVAAAVV